MFPGRIRQAVQLCSTYVSRISHPGMKAVNFPKAVAGQKLDGNVIEETEVASGSGGCCRLDNLVLSTGLIM